MGKEHIITLLVVHDDPWLRQGLRAWLERAADITVVGEASTGAEAITLAQTLHPDVSLLDIAQPTIDGAGSMAALRALTSHSTLVLLSLYDDAVLHAQARAVGAVTVVGKHEGAKALLTAIRKAGEHHHR